MRDAGVFEALLEGLIVKAAKRGEVDLSLVSVDSTTARAHHDAAGMHIDEDIMLALEKAAAEEPNARQKGAARRNKTGRPSETTVCAEPDRPALGSTACSDGPGRSPAAQGSALSSGFGLGRRASARVWAAQGR
jgi:hypothetical protein